MSITTLLFQWKPQEIKQTTQIILKEQKQVNDKLANLSKDQCTFDSVFKVLGDNENLSAEQGGALTFMQHVDMDKQVRDASADANKEWEAFEIDQSMRPDLFNTVKNTMHVKANGEDQRLMTKIYQGFVRNGLLLDKSSQDKLSKNKKKISELQLMYNKNISEDTTSLLFTREELQGLPDTFISGLKKEGDEFVVTMKYPDLFPVLKMAEKEETRKKMEIANNSRCKDNIEMLKKTIALRQENAKLLGYTDHASFKLELKMAKDKKTVMAFVNDLIEKLKPLAKKELETLLALKKEHCKDKFDDKLNAWDFQFYHRMLLENNYQVNHEKLKEYFSLDSVTKIMLELYESVLGLRFSKVSKSKYQPWHDDVETIEVYDAETNELTGVFFLDLFPREGKYSHAACFPLQPGYLKDGQQRLPFAAMVANFPKPTADIPSLLQHSEVVTYFHELGHVMHEICSRTKWSKFHGTRTEWDFVETPSQMLENWCWHPSVLSKFTHYQRKNEHLPIDLINNLIKSKNVNEGLLTLRQLFFAKFDMMLHSEQVSDVQKLWDDLRRDITMIPNTPGTFGYSTFGHIMGGYDGGYYGYMWSLVFSCDLFYSKFVDADSVLGKNSIGKDYKRQILQPGGSRDAMELLTDFLKRPPNNAKFLESIGLSFFE